MAAKKQKKADRVPDRGYTAEQMNATAWSTVAVMLSLVMKDDVTIRERCRDTLEEALSIRL